MSQRSTAGRDFRLITVFMATVLLIWVCVSPRVMPELYTARLFLPGKDRATPAQVAALKTFKDYPNREIFFAAADGKPLHGWLFSVPHAAKIFLLCPGNAGDIPRRLEFYKAILQSGASVFVYEPRGFGKSPGKATIGSICQDGVSAYDFVADTLGYQASDIVIYGVSLGTTVASELANVRPAAGLILQSGFSSLPAIAHEKVRMLRLYPSFMFPQHPALNNAANVQKLHIPLLVMHGAQDTLIGINHSRIIFLKANMPKKFVVCPHSSHVNIDPLDRPLFIGTLRTFLSQLPG